MKLEEEAREKVFETNKTLTLSTTRFIFYKNTLYKNIHDEIYQKV